MKLFIVFESRIFIFFKLINVLGPLQVQWSRPTEVVSWLFVKWFVGLFEKTTKRGFIIILLKTRFKSKKYIYF